ncbi:MAG: hypothetical protein WCG01_01085 [bacterium]
MAKKTTSPSIEKIADDFKSKLEDTSKKGIENKEAALSYVFILCFIPLLSNRDSEFVQFHAKQGFVLFVLDILIGLVSWFPLFGQLAVLVLFMTSIIGIVKALNGKYWEIPFVYEWSKKLNF